MTRRYIIRMASVVAVDFVITGIFLLVAERYEIIATELAINVLVLGLLNAVGAMVLFRPVARFLAGRGDASAARRRTEHLAELSAAWVAVVTLVYCTFAFSLGVFWPEGTSFDALPQPTQWGALAWFAFVYTAYYTFYIYFLISDFEIDLKLRLWERGVQTDPRRGWIVFKITTPLFMVAVVPTLLIVFDLTVFRELRALQGLTVTGTILLDLLSSVFLFVVSLVFVSRSLLRPIRRLMPAIETLRRGDLDAAVPITSSDELGLLTENFNEMLDGLREQAFIRDTFGRYVPEKIAAALLEGRGKLEPRSTVATILFVDMEGFTAFTEANEPEVVLGMLNAYFTAAVEPITRHGGVVNQFQGDAILATFNLPVEDPHHADQAVAAAVEIQQTIDAGRFAGARVRARVGINTGPLVAGLVGSGDRQTYAVHGDAVNLAARLEALNKELGTRILISEATAALLSNAPHLAPRGAFRLRGKSRSVTVYEVSL